MLENFMIHKTRSVLCSFTYYNCVLSHSEKRSTVKSMAMDKGHYDNDEGENRFLIYLHPKSYLIFSLSCRIHMIIKHQSL